MPGSAQPTTTATYEYDSIGRTLAQTSPSGRTQFSYDARDRLTGIDDPANGAFSFDYDEHDHLSAIVRPNGVITTYARNTVGDLTGIFHRRGLTTIDQALYTYDALGQIATMTDTVGIHAYTYDSTGQLTGVNHPGAQQDENFAYDLRGNRISGGETYDAANRLAGDAEHVYSYDDEGNLTAKTNRVTSATTTIDWDANQRQRALTDPTGVTTTYRYDPRGRRIEKSSPSQSVRYGYGLSSNPLVEYAADDSVAASFTFARGSDKPLAMRRGGQSYFHLQDMLANVTSLTDSTGTVVEDYEYSAFGEQATPGSALGNPFTFAGRQWDSESSTYYNRARQLDPSSGRFTSEDPIRSANAYIYAGNDPVSSRDPSGLFSISELSSANVIRNELMQEQMGFGMQLVSVIAGGGSDSDVVEGTAMGIAGGSIGGLARLVRLAKLADRINLDEMSSAGRVASKGNLTRAGRVYQKHMSRNELPKVPENRSTKPDRTCLMTYSHIRDPNSSCSVPAGPVGEYALYALTELAQPSSPTVRLHSLAISDEDSRSIYTPRYPRIEGPDRG